MATAKLYQAGVDDPWSAERQQATLRRITRWLEGVITIAGLFALVVAGGGDEPALILPGAIIWLGAIAVWLISGFIVRDVAGIPLRMGYGGWYVSRRRKRGVRRKAL